MQSVIIGPWNVCFDKERTRILHQYLNVLSEIQSYKWSSSAEINSYLKQMGIDGDKPSNISTMFYSNNGKSACAVRFYSFVGKVLNGPPVVYFDAIDSEVNFKVGNTYINIDKMIDFDDYGFAVGSGTQLNSKIAMEIKNSKLFDVNELSSVIIIGHVDILC